MLTRVLDLLTPLRCVACGVRSEPPWCPDCTASAGALRLDPPSTCGRCAGSVGRHVCWVGRPPVRRCDAVFRYGGVVADAIVAGKVRGARSVWVPLGVELAGRVAGPPADVVTWVPAPARRRRERGYDHAEVLARSLARQLDVPAWPVLHAPRRLPDRGQVDVGARPGIAAGAYRARAGIDRARVLLVDDVVTTGLTLTAAARALTLAGASEVSAAVLARAGAHPLGQASVRRAVRC